MLIFSLLTNGEAIWSRSCDGPFWSLEDEHELHGGGEHSRGEGSADKRWERLFRLNCHHLNIQRNHILTVRAGRYCAYRIVNIYLASAEIQCAQSEV